MYVYLQRWGKAIARAMATHTLYTYIRIFIEGDINLSLCIERVGGAGARAIASEILGYAQRDTFRATSNARAREGL